MGILQDVAWAAGDRREAPPDEHIASFDVVVIGGGQSGLSMSALLAEAGVRHVVLEAETVGSSWTRRWDSFRTNTPNATTALPGHAYAGDDPDGFASAPEVVALLTGYARDRQLPVIERCAVTHLGRTRDGYDLQTRRGRLRARAVVVASGEYRRGSRPRVPFEPAPDLQVIHSSAYRNAAQLADGAVLVVGGGQSGAQIAQDLHDAGREVYWSIASRAMNLRRLRGRDSLDWWIRSGILHRHVSQHPDVLAGLPDALQRLRTGEFPLVSGRGTHGKGSSISLLSMHRDGIVLLGRLQQLHGRQARFNDVRPQVREAIHATRAEYDRLLALAETHATETEKGDRDDARYLPEEVYLDWEPEHARERIDLVNAGIRSVVLATGFIAEWPWMAVDDVFDARGYPLGDYGVSPQRGLFFLGMYNLQRVSSSYLCNGGRDAEALLPHILQCIAPHPH